jgi:hypothetical protein
MMFSLSFSCVMCFRESGEVFEINGGLWSLYLYYGRIKETNGQNQIRKILTS